MLSNLLYVFLGGGAGSVVRFSVSLVAAQYFKSHFPLSTLIANVLSCLVMGVALLLFSNKLMADMPLRFLILTGFCGGFSTFSAFSYETVMLIKTGNYHYALLSALLNSSLCFAALWVVAKQP